MAKKIYRSKEDKMIAGVCGGIAEYFDTDPVWIRLAAVLLALINGIGIVLYIIAWIIMPENPKQKSTKETKAEEIISSMKKSHKERKANKAVIIEPKSNNGGIIIGGILILLGTVILLDKLYIWFSFKYFFPLLLILIGVHLILKREK